MNSAMPRQCQQALSQLFKTQLARVDEINLFLIKLKASIAQNDTDAINTTLSENNLPISEIEAFENNRNQLLNQYGFEANIKGQTACIKWCDNDEGNLSKQYKLLSDSLIQLQQSIQINALLVNKGQDRIRRSVSLLTGQVNNEKSNTYSKNGRTNLTANKRSISQA